MPDNKIDIVFKNQIEQLNSNELPTGWNKKESWERLENKRANKKQKLYYYAAAILVLGFLLGSLFQNSPIKNKDNSYSENAFVEYQNRQKLKEIEERMSGSYYSVKICLACDDIYYEVIKQDRPDKFTYYETILN
jgi:hypothetical protein